MLTTCIFASNCADADGNHDTLCAISPHTIYCFMLERWQRPRQITTMVLYLHLAACAIQYCCSHCPLCSSSIMSASGWLVQKRQLHQCMTRCACRADGSPISWLLFRPHLMTSQHIHELSSCTAVTSMYASTVQKTADEVGRGSTVPLHLTNQLKLSSGSS